jgi:hypothetical protein
VTANQLFQELERALSRKTVDPDTEVDMLCPTWGYEKIARLEISKDGKSLTLVPEAEA